MSGVTFTKDELIRITDFINFVYQRAEFKCSHKEFVAYNKLYVNMLDHLKKCESGIMQLEEVVPAKEKKDKK